MVVQTRPGRDKKKVKEEEQVGSKDEKKKTFSFDDRLHSWKHYYLHGWEVPHLPKDHHLREKLIHFFHVPNWLQEDFIHTGYRMNWTLKSCLKSTFMWHNETLNIWSHLLGVIMTIVLIYKVIFRLNVKEYVTEEAPRWPIVLYLISAGSCMGASTLFHLIGCMSKRVYHICSRLDYSGITFLILGSFLPLIYYGFYGDSSSQLIYLIMMIALGSVCFTLSLLERTAGPEYRTFRSLMFLGLGVAGAVPVLHMVVVYGADHDIIETILGHLLFDAGCYFSGCLVYLFQIPERWFPGKFDYIFNSHLFFHIFVVMGSYTHYKLLVDLWHMSHPSVREELMKDILFEECE